MTSHAHATRCDPTDPNHAERGVGLIEIIVVVVVIAIITAIAVPSLTGTRRTGGKLELRVAANRYADAVDRFQEAHGRVAPTLGSAEWPSASAGPVNVTSIAGSTTTRRYLTKAVPEIMTRTGPNGAKFAASAAPKGGTLVYVVTSRFNARIDAYWDGALICSAGQLPVGTKGC